MFDPSASQLLGVCRGSFNGFDIVGPIRPGKPTLLIFASCHGRTLLDYFRTRHDALADYNVVRLETGAALGFIRDGHDFFGHPDTRALFDMADVLVTYNMGARHGQMSLDRVSRLLRPPAKIITFTAPNFSCLWPVCDGYSGGLGVLDALDRGQSATRIRAEFVQGTFDPLFRIRWRIEVGRLHDKDKYHDVGLGAFVTRNIKKAKLFVGASHPSYVTMAYQGNEVLGRLGFPRESEATILAKPPLHGAMLGMAETPYEHSHYGFEYPPNIDHGWRETYLPIIDHYARAHAAGLYLIPAMD